MTKTNTASNLSSKTQLALTAEQLSADLNEALFKALDVSETQGFLVMNALKKP